MAALVGALAGSLAGLDPVVRVALVLVVGGLLYLVVLYRPARENTVALIHALKARPGRPV